MFIFVLFQEEKTKSKKHKKEKKKKKKHKKDKKHKHRSKDESSSSDEVCSHFNVVWKFCTKNITDVSAGCTLVLDFVK